MEELVCREYSAGRQFLGRLPHGEDLSGILEAFCAGNNISTAVFSLIGAVSRATLGTYDQAQQVYVTFTVEGNLEILSCMGNISLKEGKPFIHAHLVLADEGGKTIGGHLFPGTIVFAGEVFIREMAGEPLAREHDDVTGLILWNMAPAGTGS